MNELSVYTKKPQQGHTNTHACYKFTYVYKFTMLSVDWRAMFDGHFPASLLCVFPVRSQFDYG